MSSEILTAEQPAWHLTRKSPPRVGAVVHALHIGGTLHRIVWSKDSVYSYVCWQELPKIPQKIKEELWLAYTGERTRLIQQEALEKMVAENQRLGFYDMEGN